MPTILSQAKWHRGARHHRRAQWQFAIQRAGQARRDPRVMHFRGDDLHCFAGAPRAHASQQYGNFVRADVGTVHVKVALSAAIIVLVKHERMP